MDVSGIQIHPTISLDNWEACIQSISCPTDEDQFYQLGHQATCAHSWLHEWMAESRHRIHEKVMTGIGCCFVEDDTTSTTWMIYRTSTLHWSVWTPTFGSMATAGPQASSHSSPEWITKSMSRMNGKGWQLEHVVWPVTFAPLTSSPETLHNGVGVFFLLALAMHIFPAASSSTSISLKKWLDWNPETKEPYRPLSDCFLPHPTLFKWVPLFRASAHISPTMLSKINHLKTQQFSTWVEKGELPVGGKPPTPLLPRIEKNSERPTTQTQSNAIG